MLPDMDNCVMERPNGKVYRARKPPFVTFFEGDWYDKSYCLVLRCTDRGTARALANEEIRLHDPSMKAGEATFSWWREVVRNNEPYWDHDTVRGVPGWSFEVVD
jgi:cysteinyl-tRNA synthetase